MSFIATPDPTHKNLSGSQDTDITQEWWPGISSNDAREVMRLNGTVTDVRLLESLHNAIYSVNAELSDWAVIQRDLEPIELANMRYVHLYRRAVFFYAKAELTERYRDFDTTAAGDRHADDLEDAIGSARRTMRWAISDILGKPRLTVGVL